MAFLIPPTLGYARGLGHPSHGGRYPNGPEIEEKILCDAHSVMKYVQTDLGNLSLHLD